MADRSNIEWTDASWNPIRACNLKTGKVGWHCEHATTGCEFCYAEGMNKRLGTGLPFKPGHRKDIEILLDGKMLLAPLHWRRPRMIFVCSMTDLFADFVKDEWLDSIFHTMGACNDLGCRHTFQILTKRAGRMRDYMLSGRAWKAWNAPRLATEAWPPRNVWAGVSAERQQEADERIPLLLQTPAAVRFVSLEPLLGPIDLKPEWLGYRCARCKELQTSCACSFRDADAAGRASYAGLLWAIVGGESGKDARPMHPGWARALRDQCETAGVAYFFKQWGAWEPYRHAAAGIGDVVAYNGALSRGDVLEGGGERPRWCVVKRVGKKAAGRLLDGRTWDEFPRAIAPAHPATQDANQMGFAQGGEQ